MVQYFQYPVEVDSLRIDNEYCYNYHMLTTVMFLQEPKRRNETFSSVNHTYFKSVRGINTEVCQ